ncbi:Mobile element protein [Caballeronia sordidicola]|uniref:Mobile element protein n=2 Tax=Caballeronia sordidicola TaxID=196367 RepID=A0A226X338_CABSO|nr:Mobile element protein [Caballeronia sordidicola]
MSLEFIKDTANVVLIGPNGVGKSTLALNLAYQAIAGGHTALFTTAGQMLGELAALDSDSALRRRLNRYASPDVLVIDEVGYLSYSNRHADLLFELVSRRYGVTSTVVTTNRPFKGNRSITHTLTRRRRPHRDDRGRRCPKRRMSVDKTA